MRRFSFGYYTLEAPRRLHTTSKWSFDCQDGSSVSHVIEEKCVGLCVEVYITPTNKIHSGPLGCLRGQRGLLLFGEKGGEGEGRQLSQYISGDTTGLGLSRRECLSTLSWSHCCISP